MLDALNVKYILSAEPLDIPNLELVYQDEILIYQNPRALPRAALYFRAEVLPDAEAVLVAMSAPEYDPWKQVYLDSSSPFDPPPPADLAPLPARITHYDPNRVVIEVEAPQDGVLILADKNYPGWVATIDGVETPIATANYLMRAVRIPAGEHTVEFHYRSGVIRLSLWVSLLSALGLVGGIGVATYRKLSIPQSPTG
jgi:hypothetical protein